MATLKSFGIKNNGAEVYVFVNKGDTRKDASFKNVNVPYQQSRPYQDQRFDNSQHHRYSTSSRQHLTQPPNQYQQSNTTPLHQQQQDWNNFDYENRHQQYQGASQHQPYQSPSQHKEVKISHINRELTIATLPVTHPITHHLIIAVITLHP